MKDLALFVLVVLCLAMAFGLEYSAYVDKTRFLSTDVLAGGALFTAIGLALPLQLGNVVSIGRRVFPWLDRRNGNGKSATHDTPDKTP